MSLFSCIEARVIKSEREYLFVFIQKLLGASFFMLKS